MKTKLFAFSLLIVGLIAGLAIVMPKTTQKAQATGGGCEDANYTEIATDTMTVVTWDGTQAVPPLPPGHVAVGVCIKAGEYHSEKLIQNGSDPYSGAYIVEGLGTTQVSVSEIPNSGWFDISHIDIYTDFPPHDYCRLYGATNTQMLLHIAHGVNGQFSATAIAKYPPQAPYYGIQKNLGTRNYNGVPQANDYVFWYGRQGALQLPSGTVVTVQLSGAVKPATWQTVVP